jgi:hypothetical protein
MLDFGFAVHEQVWKIDGGRVRLAKLAPRLPITAYRWLTDERGEELAALEQMGYRGSQYVVTQIPANKMDLFTFHQEGQNYTGLSLLRPMYQHWYIKSNLYKVDAVACERNGMGVPTITMGEVKNGQPFQEDRDNAMKWVQELSTHQRTGLVLPPGWTFSLEAPKGTVRDPKDSIAHHNTMISMAGLTMFMQLGQTHGGNRALGDTMADFFYMSLQAVTEQISRTMSLGTVKRLVDYNFTGIERYPVVKAQQILTVKFESIVDALQKLAVAGIVEPDDTLESAMREKMGLPAVDKATVRPVPGAKGNGGGEEAEAASGQPDAKPGASNGKGQRARDNADGTVDVGPSAEGGEGGIDPESGEGMPTAEEIEAAAQVIRAAMGDRMLLFDAGSVHVDGAMGGGKPAGMRRLPHGPEMHLALSDIVNALDKGRDEIAAALRKARPRIQAGIIHKVMSRPVGQMHRASVDADQELVAEVERILRGVSDFGFEQVGDERKRQRAGAAPEDAAKIRMSDARAKDPIGLYADGVVSEFTNTLSARATNAAIDRKRKGGTDGAVIQAVQSALDGQSDKWIDGVAAKGANEAFAEGRNAAYDEYADEIGSVIYSALLDLNTCENCAAADGAEGATPSEIPDVPNPDCDGGDKCRCVHVYVFKSEVKGAA